MGTLQEAIAKMLRSKKEKPPEDPAEAGMNPAEKMVRKVSDDKAPGVIQRRKRLYEQVEKQTKDE